MPGFLMKLLYSCISAPSLASKRLIKAQKSLKTPISEAIHLFLIMGCFYFLRKNCFNPPLKA
jgi:hypothetical protein